MTMQMVTDTDFYSFKVTTLSGDTFDFDQLRGKRVLIVNSASECGYTPQYSQLQELYERFGDGDFIVLAFPSNDFGGQEPGSRREIASFCVRIYGVTFPVMDKVIVTGDSMHPVFQWLTRKALNGVGDAVVSWNFNKFLIDEKGQWLAHYGSKTPPLDEEIVRFARGEWTAGPNE